MKRKRHTNHTLEMRVGAICNAGGRTLEIQAPHQQWLDWALNALYAQAEREKRMEATNEASTL